MIKLIMHTCFNNHNRLRIYYDCLQRKKNIKKNKGSIPEYLRNNDFQHELNYKLWVTKGARFKASERCDEMDRRSTKIVGFLSAYLIIFQVMPLCEIKELTPLNNNVINLISITLAILILVYSQFEYAMGYAVKSKMYHDCAIEISKIYDRLRLLKNKNLSEIDKEKNLDEIESSYQNILDQYINHMPIDYDYFKATKEGYFNLSKWEVRKIKWKYAFKVRASFFLCIYGLPTLYVLSIIL